MILTGVEKIKKYFIFYFVVIFFTFVSVLCPIENLYTQEKVSDAKKVSDNQKKTAQNNNDTADEKASLSRDTLYDYEKPAAEEESYTWLIFKTILVLAVLVGGFYYFYRFVTRKTGIQTIGRDVIKVLSIVPVGQNKFLQVVDLAGRIMVIGVSDSSINLIAEIQDKNEIDRIRLLSSKSSPVHPGGFQDYISKYVSRFFRKESRNNAEGDHEIRYRKNEIAAVDKMDYLKKQRERLKKINGNNNEI